MDSRLEANKEHWNAVTPIHLGPGEVYDVQAFKQGKSSLLPIELEELGGVAGKRLLHPQCHIGVDTMSWARLGADATGVDFSEKAIDTARKLNQTCGLDCRFICCNIYDLPQHLHEQFDIVFVSYGALCWLPDLPKWAQILADFLRSGGTFLVIDFHPFARCFCEASFDKAPAITEAYFHDGTGLLQPASDASDYHSTASFAGNDTYEWAYTVGDVVNAVAGAGLRIESFHEFSEAPARVHDGMVKGEDGLFRFPNEESLIPELFSLKAIKR